MLQCWEIHICINVTGNNVKLWRVIPSVNMIAWVLANNGGCLTINTSCLISNCFTTSSRLHVFLSKSKFDWLIITFMGAEIDQVTSLQESPEQNKDKFRGLRMFFSYFWTDGLVGPLKTKYPPPHVPCPCFLPHHNIGTHIDPQEAPGQREPQRTKGSLNQTISRQLIKTQGSSQHAQAWASITVETTSARSLTHTLPLSSVPSDWLPSAHFGYLCQGVSVFGLIWLFMTQVGL